MHLFGKFGYYGSVEEIQTRLRRSSLYNNGEKVIVFDLDEVLVWHKKQYEHGVVKGKSKEVLHNQAREVVRMACSEIGNVVFWTAANLDCETNGRAKLLTTSPFDEIGQYIEGTSIRFYSAIKYLKLVTPNLENVVALEDRIKTFIPKNRVVTVGPHDNLLERYCQARDLLLHRRRA